MTVIQPEFIPLNNSENFNPVISFNQSGELLSSYKDNTWDFSPYIHNKNVSRSRRCLNFEIKLENGLLLTDDENVHFLSGIKEFIYLRMHVQHPRSGKTLSPQTLISKFFCSVTVINYLLLEQRSCLSHFSQNHVEPFIRYIKNRNPKLANNTLSKYLSFIEDLYHYREKLSKGIKHHPWPQSSVIHLSNDRKHKGCTIERQTPCIPDELCAELFKQSVGFIKENSKQIINAYTSIENKLNDVFSEEIKRNKQSSGLATSRPDINALYLASRSRKYLKYMKASLFENGFESKIELNKAIIKARTCCYVILATTTGMRNSELASLTNKSLITSTGWDDECYYWLQGYTYKLESHPKEAKWMVPEIAKIAIDHLTALGKIYNKKIDRSIEYLTESEATHQKSLINHLFIAQDTKTNLMNGLSNDHWNKCLRNLSQVFDLQVKDNNNDLSLPVGSLWPLTSHHFRRSFACLAARSALGDLRYLREHFKHWSLDMTLHYANDQEFDDSLFDEVLTERNELQSVIVSDWLVTDAPLTGGRGENIATFRERGQLKTATNLKGLVSQISDSVFVRGSGHSWCLASGNGCGGEGLYDAIQCVDCSNSVIDKTHLPAWKGLKKQNEKLADLPDAGIAIKERAKQYIAHASKIIARLDEND